MEVLRALSPRLHVKNCDLKPEIWRESLKGSKLAGTLEFVISGIENGFRVNYRRRTVPDLPRTEAIVAEYLVKEVVAGRIVCSTEKIEFWNGKNVVCLSTRTSTYKTMFTHSLRNPSSCL